MTATRHSATLTLVWLVVVFAPAAVRANAPGIEASYAVTDLGPLPMIADDVAVSLNASGQAALWTQANGQTVQAAVWTRGQRQGIGSLIGCPNSIAHAVNDRGEVAGWANTSANPVDSLSTTRAFVWRHGRMLALGTLGGRDSRAFGINKNGQIVGVSDRADGTRHAFLCQGNALIDLGTLPGGRYSQAYAINAAGDIVGVAGIGQAIKHAVLWRKGRITDLGTLPRGVASSAQAINNRDQVAGYSETPDGTHAFLVTDGRMQDLGTLGNDPSLACGLNDQGQVVGASNVSASARHAFLWQTGRMSDLNALVPSDSGWTLLQAYAINNAGQIVCAGRRAREPAHVLLLTPVSKHF